MRIETINSGGNVMIDIVSEFDNSKRIIVVYAYGFGLYESQQAFDDGESCLVSSYVELSYTLSSHSYVSNATSDIDYTIVNASQDHSFTVRRIM